jgi:hypothetical protein
MCWVLWMSLERVFIVVTGGVWLPVPALSYCHDVAVRWADRWYAAPCVPLVAPLDAICYT